MAHSNEPAGTVVIVGGGHAGAELAFSLREQGWKGKVVLLSEESYLPYHRPPLSKNFMVGNAEVDSLALRPASAYQKADIEWVGGVHVDAIHRDRKVITLADGRELPYAKLALATGGKPRRLPQAQIADGATPDNVHYLRTADDGLRLRAQFRAGARVVVVGGGYIGLEVAAAAVKQGLQVVVLEAASRLLARVTSPEISAFYERMHQAAGVEVRTNAQVESFEFSEEGRRVVAVSCVDGTRRIADILIIGIGLAPSVELARDAGLAVDDGIVVDERCRTSDPDIVAAGDCTRHPSTLLNRMVRLESVPNALEQARTAAATVCGADRPHRAIPWFWSDQYDLKLRSAGLMAGHDTLVVRGSMDAASFSVFYLKGGLVQAVDTVNRPQDFMQSKRLIADRAAVNPEALADDAVPLKEAIRAQ